MTFLRSLLFNIVFYIGSVGIVGLNPIFSARGRIAQIKHTILWASYFDWCARHILGISWRVEGTVPAEPCLIAMKHESMFETVQIFLMFDRPAPVIKKELRRIPMWGDATRIYGSIAVDRDAGAKAMRALLIEARELIGEGRPILIFPEGTRVPHGTRPELKAGLAGLYRMLGLPLVPIACDSGKLWPRGAFLKRAGVVTFKVGETIPPGLPREDVEARVWESINQLNS